MADLSSASVLTSTPPVRVQFPREPLSTSTALSTACRGTVAFSLTCFVISYIALADLAHIAGLGPQAYLWPVMIDGNIVVATVAVVAVSDWHSWSLLVAAGEVSLRQIASVVGVNDRTVRRW